MRQVYTNRVVVILAALLLAAAALLAWSRSRPTAPVPTAAIGKDATAPRIDDTAGPATAIDFAQLAAGQREWESRCARCHRAAESEGVLPAELGDRARELAVTAKGRAALVRLLVDGTAADSDEGEPSHPTYASLSDQDLRNLLNLMLYADALSDAVPPARPKAYALSEIARLRAPLAESPEKDKSQ